MTHQRFPVLRAVVALAAAAVLILGPLQGDAMATAVQPDGVDNFDRDVFVIVGSTLRNPDASTDPAKPLFTDSGIRLESSPGDPITWGEWTAAGVKTSAVRSGGGTGDPYTDAAIKLTGLIPGGVYSIYWGTLQPDSEQPLCPGVERTLPLDAVDPRQAPARNAFVASATGTGGLAARVGGHLLDARQLYFSVVYHFSGQTQYPFPNRGEFLTQGPNCRSSFGADSMRQVLILQKW